MRRPFLAALAALICVGCTVPQHPGPGANEAEARDAVISVDRYDGATWVKHAPNPVATTLDQTAYSPYFMGFDWTSKTPELAYITFVIRGETVNITGIRFNADGHMIESARSTQALTDFGDITGPQESHTRFALPLADLVTIAGSQDVRIRVDHLNTYRVVEYGVIHGPSVIQGAINNFLKGIASAGGPVTFPKESGSATQ